MTLELSGEALARRVVEAPERMLALALEAEDLAEQHQRQGNPVAAREWLDVAIAARQLFRLASPQGSGETS